MEQTLHEYNYNYSNKNGLQELVCFTKQDALVYLPHCNSPMLSSPELFSLEVCGYDILFAHFKGIKCLPPFPTLPYPQEAVMWLPERIAQSLLQYVLRQMGKVLTLKQKYLRAVWLQDTLRKEGLMGVGAVHSRMLHTSPSAGTKHRCYNTRLLDKYIKDIQLWEEYQKLP